MYLRPSTYSYYSPWTPTRPSTPTLDGELWWPSYIGHGSATASEHFVYLMINVCDTLQPFYKHSWFALDPQTICTTHPWPPQGHLPERWLVSYGNPHMHISTAWVSNSLRTLCVLIDQCVWNLTTILHAFLACPGPTNYLYYSPLTHTRPSFPKLDG